MPDDRRDVLLDTHVLLWWYAAAPRLSPLARATLTGPATILISPVVCWEVSMLAVKGRVRLDRPTSVWVRDLLSRERVRTAPLTPSAAVAAAELPDFHGDPADRQLYATARSSQAVLLTKDEALHRYAREHGDVMTRW